MKKTTLIYLKFLLYFFLPLYARVLSLCQLLGLKQRIESSAIIFPPAASGSLGDEAMIHASIDFLRKKDVKKFGLIIYRKNKDSAIENADQNINQIDMSDFFKCSKLHQLLLISCKVFWEISGYQRIYLLGADVMDGYYSDDRLFRRLTILSMASKLNMFATIVGCSYNDKPSRISIDLLRGLSYRVPICIRDAISLKRFKQNVSSSATLTADAALLLNPVDDTSNCQDVVKWIECERQVEKNVVGINLSSHIVQVCPGKSSDDYIRAFVNTIQAVYEEYCGNLAFVLLPHDHRQISVNLERKKISDDSLCQEIIDSLPPEIRPSCIKIPFPCLAAEIKGIVGYLDCVITGRMHLAIACFGQGIPVGAITYQGKFEGLYNHFNIPPLMLEPEQIFEDNQFHLINLIIHLMNHKDSIRQQILHELVTVKALSASNF